MSADVLIVGGGLAGSLAAWRLVTTRPTLEVRLLEAGDRLGGNHTWSFHATDIDAVARQWVAPLVAARWPAHGVAFPGETRTLASEYCSVSSARLDEVIGAALGRRVTRGVHVEHVSPTEVRCAGGERLEAGVVIDARGAGRLDLPVAWQTFLGQEVECATPHGVATPLLMDATVPQDRAFKFMYVLPFSETRLLVEDTAYADHADVESAAARTAIRTYADAHGWRIARLVREETGSLPLPLGGSIDAFWEGEVPRIGLRAGLFHPTTGYSLPDAVATADLLASLNPLTPARVYSEVRASATAKWKERAFLRLLNRWLFRAARPERRVDVLAQFYRRPADLIARFYAGRLSGVDRVRLLTGRPPVPVWRALAHVRE